MAQNCIQPFTSGEFYHNPNYISDDVTFIAAARAANKKNAIIKLYTADGVFVCGFYVTPGKTLQTKVPTGTYQFRFSYGTNWFGDDEMFGDEGFYAIYVENSTRNYTFNKNSRWTFTVGNTTDKGEPVSREEF